MENGQLGRHAWLGSREALQKFTMLIADAHGYKDFRCHLFLGDQEVTDRSDSFSSFWTFSTESI